jgi:hypothetical protein
MPELLNTFKAMQKTEEEKRNFLALLQGVDLREKTEEKGSSFEEVRMRALGINASRDDIVSLQGPLAAEAGFGIGAGLGYSRE